MHGIVPETKTKEGSYVCHLCDYRSKYARDLQKHLIRVHEKNENKKNSNPYWCHVCDFSTKFNTNLRNHVVKNHGKAELKNITKPKENLTPANEEDPNIENTENNDLNSSYNHFNRGCHCLTIIKEKKYCL